MDITEIRNQRLSTILTDFMICQSCRIVDNNRERMRVGYECPRCGIPGKHGMIYFPMTVQSTIDLMQEFYNPEQQIPPDFVTATDGSESNHRLAVVIFFCTLTEVLLKHFLEQLMNKKKLPHKIQDRLLNDNRFVNQKIQSLFPALADITWKKAAAKLEKHTTFNYSETAEFCQLATDARNKFLHSGNKWNVFPHRGNKWTVKNMAEPCMKHIWPLVNLFVALHNEYVADSLNENNVSRLEEGKENA